MRHLKDHELRERDQTLIVEAVSETGPGGTCHHYEISSFDTKDNPYAHRAIPRWTTSLVFQHGPVPLNGRNGITQEALLAVVVDRLRCFQAGPFPCAANAQALALVEEALEVLKGRTRDRITRHVEGQDVV